MTPSGKLVIVGDGLFAEIAHEYFEHDSPYEVWRSAWSGRSCIGRSSAAYRSSRSASSNAVPPGEHSVFVALTYAQINRVRTRLVDAAAELGYPLASYVSSRAFVWRNVELGEHCFIFEDNTVQPFVTVGRNCVL